MIGWPILVTQAGRHGNREVMLPANIGPDLLRSVLAGLVGAGEESAATRAVPVAAGDGTRFTLVSRRVRATSDCAARVWDLRSPHPPGPLVGHEGLVSGVSVSRDGLVAATAGWDYTLRTWNARSGEQLALVTDPSSRFSGCRLDPGGRILAATGFDGAVGFYDARGGGLLWRAQVDVNLPGAVALNPGASVVFAGGQDGTVRRVRRRRGELAPLGGHVGPVTALALSPNGRLLASAGRDGAVIVWDLKAAQRVMRLSGHAEGVTDCAFLNGSRLLTSGWDGAVRLWDLAVRTMRTLWQDGSAIRALAVTDRGVLASSQRGVITAVDPSGRADPAVLSIVDGHVDAMAGAPGAPVLVTGSANDVRDGVAVRDGYGRPATFTEGLLLPEADRTGELPPWLWDRVHAESLGAMGIVSADPSGRTIVAAPRLALG